MIKTFIKQSGKVSELRKTCNLCGKMYSGRFYDSQYEEENKNVMAKSYSNNHVIALFRQEYIEVMQSETGELLWKAVEQLSEHEYEFDFQSSLGVFRSRDRGEFGGMLITPKGTIQGNFCNLFEFNGKVYAIDSLNHMGIAHTRIYEFDKDMKSTLLYKTGNIYDLEETEMLSLSSLSIEDDRILILISGGEFGENHSFADLKACSYLFEISKEGFKELAKFDIDFEYVYNMLLVDNTLILGMDKVVGFADINTKEITFFTPLNIEAEQDIKNTENR